jgi:hypothetical protein
MSVQERGLKYISEVYRCELDVMDKITKKTDVSPSGLNRTLGGPKVSLPPGLLRLDFLLTLFLAFIA